MKEIRDLIKRMEEHLAEGADDPFSAGYDDATELWKTELEALLPPRTLADLTDEERADTIWMQADTDQGELAIIISVGKKGCSIAYPDGELGIARLLNHITPRFDLPKLNPWDPPSARSVKTEEEYEGLPDGSVVAAEGEKPWVKKGHLFYCYNGPSNGISAKHMAGFSNIVLREGWRP